MSRQAWLTRLSAQLPGWVVWYTSPPGRGWHAVPAPAGMAVRDARQLPHRLGPCETPQELRTLARERYGWDDCCESCVGMLARECGHRRPESVTDPLPQAAPRG
jgi:hypothetical protein